MNLSLSRLFSFDLCPNTDSLKGKSPTLPVASASQDFKFNFNKKKRIECLLSLDLPLFRQELVFYPFTLSLSLRGTQLQ